MNRSLPQLLHIFLPLLFLQSLPEAFAQNTSFPIDEWVKKLAVKTDPYNDNFWTFTVKVRSMDSSGMSAVLNGLQKKGANAGKRFQIRFKQAKAQLMYLKFTPKDYGAIDTLLKEALFEAYEINDLALAALASRQLGEINYFAAKLEPAAMYGLNAVELLEKSGEKFNWNESYTFWILGEIMYHAGEYEKSVYYTLKSFKYGLDTTYPDKTGQMMGWNTIGMSYQQLGKYDSALIAFDKSLQIANTNHNQIWEGIGEGNKAKIFFLQKKFEQAKPLLSYDYVISKQNGVFDNAGYSLQWLALINLHEGKKDSALLKAKEALELFTRQASRQPFLNEIYNTLSEIYRSMGKLDSFYYYNHLSTHLRDSLERVMAVSQVEIVRTKLEHQQYVLKIQSFQKEKETEELKRNFIIAAIIFVAAIALLILNRQAMPMLLIGPEQALQALASGAAVGSVMH